MIMSKTLAECHSEIVKELESRGETVYNPVDRSMLRKGSHPKVYVKGRPFPSNEFLCGTAIREKDGTISILAESMANLRGVGSFHLGDLGLCDPVLYYANHEKIHHVKTPDPKDERPTSSGELVLWLEEKVEKLEKRVRSLEKAK
jgi:hypothetical protein